MRPTLEQLRVLYFDLMRHFDEHGPFPVSRKREVFALGYDFGLITRHEYDCFLRYADIV